MYCMRFHIGILFGRGGGAPSVLRQVRHLLLHQWNSGPVASSGSSSQSLFAIGSVTAYTSGLNSTFW